MTTWSPDTCDCKLEFNKNVNWIKSNSFCRLHKNLRGQIHLETVLAQNRRFNLAFGTDELIDEEKTILSLSKEVNKRRIRIEDVRNFVEDIPDRPQEDLSYWQQLRNLFG